MAPTTTPADDHRARGRRARVSSAARITAAVLTGLAAAACGTLHAASLQPVSNDPAMVAVATASASGSLTATAKHTAKPKTSATPSRTPSSASHKRSAADTGPTSPSPSTTSASPPATATGPTPPPAPPPTQPASSGCQQNFVPSYFYSGTLWDQVIDTSPRPSVMFLNVDNGVGTGPVAHFQQLVKAAQQQGITVLGYSSTEYTGRPIAQVEAEVADYKAWYGVNGIMLDLGQGTSGALPYYQQLYNYIHSVIPGADIWINFGSFPVSSFTSVANVMMVFEGSYSSFQSDSVPSWVNGYPRDRFAQVIYDTPDADLSAAVSASWSRRAGYVFVTDQGLPNPYGALPSYWSSEASVVGAEC
jgi:glutathione peroxidase-family protein